MSKLSEFCDKMGVKLELDYHCSKSLPESMPKGSASWEATLSFKDMTLSVPFFQGPAIKEPPTAADVLSCLLLDATGYDDARNFEDWAPEFGYDPDSRKAEKIYHECGEISKKLHALLGDHFQDFVDNNAPCRPPPGLAGVPHNRLHHNHITGGE